MSTFTGARLLTCTSLYSSLSTPLSLPLFFMHMAIALTGVLLATTIYLWNYDVLLRAYGIG